MRVKEFVDKAVKQDKRNTFGKSSKESAFVPKLLRQFYMEANPLDVEVSMDGNFVKFYPLAELKDLQESYILNDEHFVFATCNSDPIFVLEDKIYTCYHGSKFSEREFISDSFEKFLNMID